MRRKTLNVRMFREAEMLQAPLPPLQPYIRCTCGTCRECKDNAKWDRVFEKFAVTQYGEERGLFRSPLSDL